MRTRQRPRAIAAWPAAALLLLASLAILSRGASASTIGAPPPTTGSGKRVLVLVSGDDVRAEHGQLIEGLTSAGLEVDVRGHKDGDLALRDYDAWRYDHLLLLAPRASGFGGAIDKEAIIGFADSGGNVLLALAPGASDLLRGLAAEMGVEVDAKGTRVYDHFSRQAGDGADDASLIATSAWVDSDAILGKARPKAPVLFRGLAQAVPSSSELAVVALSGEATAYSHDPKKAPAEPPLLPAGGTAALVTLLQARNNARVMVAGSIEMLSNALFDAPVVVAATGKTYPKSGNKAFALATALWTFQRRGVLEVGPPMHADHRTGEAEPPLYRVKDDAEFSIDIIEVDGDERRPYKADDVQLEFVMLDPHIRQPLVASDDGKFSLKFTVPDVYGVFKFVVDYKRAGYSYVNLQKVVPVRPFRHDEYERFLPPAFPYYAASLSTGVAFFLLGLVYLYGKS